MHLSFLGTSLKIPSRYKSHSCIRNYTRPAICTSSLLCGIGDLPRVASEAQTNGSRTWQGQDYWTIGL
jgi:hypothetical protein